MGSTASIFIRLVLSKPPRRGLRFERGQRGAPVESLLGHPFHKLRIFMGDVVRLRAVHDDIVKLGASAVGVYKEFPGTVAEGEIRAAIPSLRIAKRFVVAAVFPKERALSRP